MKRLYLRILCLFGKHGRGKRIEDTPSMLAGLTMYQCSRCGATWTRKVRVKGQA